MKLTTLEKKAFDAAVESSAGNGHDFGFTQDIVETLGKAGIPPQAAGALITSLEKKDLIYVWADDTVTNETGTWTQIDLTEAGHELRKSA